MYDEYCAALCETDFLASLSKNIAPRTGIQSEGIVFPLHVAPGVINQFLKTCHKVKPQNIKYK